MLFQFSKRVLPGIVAALLLMTVPADAVEIFKVSSYGAGSQIWFEAEDFDERDPADESSFALSDEPGAFGRSISSVNSDDGASMIRYTFDISKAGGAGGSWYFWGCCHWLLHKADQNNQALSVSTDLLYPGWEE